MKPKLFLSGVFALAALTSMSQGTEPSMGTGSLEDPYQIEVFDHLVWMSENFSALDKHYIQMADIDASPSTDLNDGAGFKPIGTYDEFNNEIAFSGTYDGNGFSISNLYISRPDTGDFQGFFGSMYNATVTDLTIEDADISGNEFVGILGGYVLSNSTVSGCTVSGNVAGTGSEIGGLLGGISGVLTVAYIDGCSVEVFISATGVDGVLLRETVGGLVGFADDVEITDCAVDSEIAAPNFRNVGGFIGSSFYSNIRLIHTSGSVLGREAVGGVIGYAAYTDMDSCYASVEVESTEMNVGGFGGGLIHCEVSYCHALGNVTLEEGNGGGFSGFTSFTTYEQCFANGNVSGEGNYLGGFIGQSQQGSLIRNCYARGEVSSTDDYAGGFIGINNSASEIVNCYSTGKSGVTDEVGGFGGYSVGMVTDCFWDVESSELEEAFGQYGGSEPEYLSGKTTSEMMNDETFTNLANGDLSAPWDFVDNPFDDTADEDVWAIDPEINNGYPYLTKNITPQGVTTSVFDPFYLPDGAVPAITLSPNPWNPQKESAVLKIESTDFTPGNYEVAILNIQGKVVLERMAFIQNGATDQGEWSIPLSLTGFDFDPGVYFIVLSKENALKGIGKVVVNY